MLGELSERDREVLDFERQWWKYAGAKEQAVRDKFDMSSTRYYQVLNALIDRPRRWPTTRCSSAGSAGSAPPASAPARRAASASRSEMPLRHRVSAAAAERRAPSADGDSAPTRASRCPRRWR